MDERFEPEHLEYGLKSLANTIRQLAEKNRGNNLALLSLLRTLESVHQEVRDSLFQESLPDNRQALYNLLKDIEASGGWPYIYRTKLQALLANLQPLPEAETQIDVTRSSSKDC